MAELIPRGIFLHGNRQPDVTFFTSSMAKYFQAKTMFNSCGLRLSNRAHDEDPYREDYSGSPEDLLTGAIGQVRLRSGTSGYVLIEDTAIRIDAFSDEVDRPGLAAKEWFAATSFEELASKLEEADSWGCTVISRIALAEPGRVQPTFFYGSISGQVVRSLPDTVEVSNPWLDPSSFSGWFIPDGANKTLAEMSFEESLKYDFRARSLLSLIDHLEHVTLALNAPAGSYRIRQQGRFIGTHLDQPELFSLSDPSAARNVVVAIGPPCSGKTTFGLRVAKDFNFQFCDASSLVRAEMTEEEPGRSDIGDFSLELLRDKGADYIARLVSDTVIVDDNESYVVTGFRMIEEIQLFRERYPELAVVSLIAPRRTRYDRYRERGSRAPRSFDEFRQMDELQRSMGLLRVADVLSDYRIRNVYSMTRFFEQAHAVIEQHRNGAGTFAQARDRRLELTSNQLYRCLLILRNAGRPLTTQELEASFEGVPIRYNNANKILKRYPDLVSRHESRDENVRYQITVRGTAFVAAVQQLLPSS